MVYNICKNYCNETRFVDLLEACVNETRFVDLLESHVASSMM